MKMKNKKAEQANQRAQRKQDLQRQKRGLNLAPEQEYRTEKEIFLIVCEGKNTEPSYFKQFRLKTATIKVVGEGYNTVSLVERAETLSKKGSYDQIWCVFDKDDFNDFNNAIQKAANLGFKTAWSNQAFEYWLLLHFENHQGGGIDRNDYYDKINTYLRAWGIIYDKDSKIITEAIFNILQETQNQAIVRAKRNLIFHQEVENTPAQSESCTLVFQLVEEIMKYL